MALKKSQLYSSLWSSCDELRGGMDASQYKDYVLTLLFVKYVSDKYAGKPGALIDVPEGGNFADMVAAKGDPNIGERLDVIIARLAEANGLKGVIDVAEFNNEEKLGRGKEMQDRLSRQGRLTDLTSSDKVSAVRSPVGKTAMEAAKARAARSAPYLAERERTRSWVAIAKLVIHRRTVLGMTQQELATRAKTSYSAISRLEGGRHATHLETLHRIFAALGADLLVGYEVRAHEESRTKRERELVAV